MSNENKEQPISAEEILGSNISSLSDEGIKLWGTYYRIEIRTKLLLAMQEYSDQQTAELKKEYEDRLIIQCMNSDFYKAQYNEAVAVIGNNKMISYNELQAEKAKSDKMREALVKIERHYDDPTYAIYSDEYATWLTCNEALKSLEVEDGN